MKTYRQFLSEGLYWASISDAYDQCLREKRRIPETEELIKSNGFWATKYAFDVIKGRWPEAEEEISKLPGLALPYVKKILHNRWPEAEETLESNSYYWRSYIQYLRLRPVKIQLEWLKDGISNSLLNLLNDMRMKPEVQEAVIKARPDLIGRIHNLSPKLKLKYRHEKELGHVDL